MATSKVLSQIVVVVVEDGWTAGVLGAMSGGGTTSNGISCAEVVVVAVVEGMTATEWLVYLLHCKLKSLWEKTWVGATFASNGGGGWLDYVARCRCMRSQIVSTIWKSPCTSAYRSSIAFSDPSMFSLMQGTYYILPPARYVHHTI